MPLLVDFLGAITWSAPAGSGLLAAFFDRRDRFFFSFELTQPTTQEQGLVLDDWASSHPKFIRGSKSDWQFAPFETQSNGGFVTKSFPAL